jgi:hypothetical protein
MDVLASELDVTANVRQKLPRKLSQPWAGQSFSGSKYPSVTKYPPTSSQNVTDIKCHSRRNVGWTNSVGQNVAHFLKISALNMLHTTGVSRYYVFIIII